MAADWSEGLHTSNSDSALCVKDGDRISHSINLQSAFSIWNMCKLMMKLRSSTSYFIIYDTNQCVCIHCPTTTFSAQLMPVFEAFHLRMISKVEITTEKDAVNIAAAWAG